MAEGLSAADVMALTRGDNDGFMGGGGVGWFILLFIFLLAISGNGFFGNRAVENTDYVTTAQLYSSLGNQDLKNDVRSGFAAVADREYAIDKDIVESRFVTQLGFQNLGQQLQECCCNLKTLVIEQNQATRDLIQSNYIDGLRTALSDAKTEISNREQNDFILGQLGRYYANPSVNPYTCYNTCGCNNGNLV